MLKFRVCLPEPDTSPWFTQVESEPIRARVAFHVELAVILASTTAFMTPPGGVETLLAPSSVAPVTCTAADAAACPAARAARRATRKIAPRTRRAVARMRAT